VEQHRATEELPIGDFQLPIFLWSWGFGLGLISGVKSRDFCLPLTSIEGQRPKAKDQSAIGNRKSAILRSSVLLDTMTTTDIKQPGGK